MPTQRKTTTKSTAKRKTGTSTTARKRRPAKKSDIDRRWSILLFALGALFLILAFVPGSSVWLTLRESVLFGAFGISGWLIGPFFLYWAVLVGMEKPLFSAVIRCIVFMLALSGAALIFGKLDIAGLKFGELLAALLESGKASTVGGGLISLLFGAPVLALMGRPAAYVFIVLIVIIAAMVFTGVTPAEVVRFFVGLANRIPKREYEDYDEEDFVEETPLARTQAAGSSPTAGTTAPAPRRGRKKKKTVDIDLGPDTASAPGQAENGEVEIGPGGTFGMNPLGEKEAPPAEYDEPILPFDPHSPQSLYDEPAPGSLTFNRSQVRSVGSAFAGEATDAATARVQPSAKFAGAGLQTAAGQAAQGGTGIAPGAGASFGVNAVAEALGGSGDTPAAQPAPGAQDAGLFPGEEPEEAYGSIFAPGSVFDEPAQETKTDAAPFDLFGGSTPTPVQGKAPGTTMAGEIPGEAAASAHPSVQAMIDKAAQVKDEGKVEDNRPEQDTFVQYVYPPASLFSPSASENNAGAREEMQKTADLLVNTLASFGVQTRILDVSRGPSVTRYEIQPQTGVKISRITNLADDIALNLAAAGVRIEAPIPGKPAVGIEVPNKIKSTVSIRSILESSAFSRSESPLTIALGKDIAGESVVADLAKMPHLLVAGSTGSGKSVCINSIIMSLLYKSSPDDVRLMLIDPKVVELAEYNGIPHLLMPVVTEPRKAASALGGMVAEMEKRYHMFAENNVRDIKTFNKKAERDGALEKMPYIAIVIDELADLMMTSGKEVEDYICRIAQKARAAGMHLIVATQRPSVDVITGLIKANIPSRIAFAVSSQVDSRTILDGAGAEKLLGMGDMLFMPVGANKPVRVQGTYVKDKEISGVIRFVKQNSGGSRYDEDFIASVESRMKAEGGPSDGDGSDDSLMADETFQAAVEVALENGQISTSFLQRRLRLGYARAGRIMDQMEQMGIISQPEGSKPRQVLISRQQWLEMSMNAHD